MEPTAIILWRALAKVKITNGGFHFHALMTNVSKPSKILSNHLACYSPACHICIICTDCQYLSMSSLKSFGPFESRRTATIGCLASCACQHNSSKEWFRSGSIGSSTLFLATSIIFSHLQTSLVLLWVLQGAPKIKIDNNWWSSVQKETQLVECCKRGVVGI